MQALWSSIWAAGRGGGWLGRQTEITAVAECLQAGLISDKAKHHSQGKSNDIVSKLFSVTDALCVYKQVVKTDEPACSVVEGSQWEMNLCVSAVCDYVACSCSADSIHFKDTMLYQTRQKQ